MLIDIHNHYFPKEYLKTLEKRQAWPIISSDEIGRPIIIDKGVRIVTITEAMSNIETRMRDMNASGVDMQALSLTTPSVNLPEIEDSVALAKLVNDEIAQIVDQHPDRFVGLATLPYEHGTRTLEELDRAIKDLGMKGVIMFSNINGKTIDSPEFWPFYERVTSLQVPIFLHPTTPLVGDVVKHYRLGPMIGFPLDTTLAILRIILSGVLDKYPTLTFVLAHLGGVIPYLLDRIDFCYHAYPECQVHISKPPSKYFDQIYYDTVNFYEPALMCAYTSAGPDKLLLGSDYPHVIGDLPRSVQCIQELTISPKDKRKILGENAMHLLDIK
jgi:aminocarboxymuconate-semialdehyde decarboxylase